MNLSEYRTKSAAINAAVKTALAQQGLTLDKISARINDRTGEVRMTLTLHDPKHNGGATDPRRENWKALAPLYGLKPEWLDQTFTQGGETFKIVGLEPKKRKRPVIAARLRDGKSFVWDPSFVKLVMTKVAA